MHKPGDNGDPLGISQQGLTVPRAAVRKIKTAQHRDDQRKAGPPEAQPWGGLTSADNTEERWVPSVLGTELMGQGSRGDGDSKSEFGAQWLGGEGVW